MPRRSIVAIALFLVAACGSAASGHDVGTGDTTAELPPPGSTVVAPPPVEVDATTTTRTASTHSTPAGHVSTTLVEDEPVGSRAAGNRVILIGDSLFAYVAQRYGGEMCNALVPLGWRAEVDAEKGQQMRWGNEVLDERLAHGWDTSVVFLGSNYFGDRAEFRGALERMVSRLSPQPIVLLTVTEYTPSRREVNNMIREVAAAHANVTVVDWAAITAADPSLLGADGLHLLPAGELRLAEVVAAALGPAPVSALSPAACLPTRFTGTSRD